MMMIPRIERDPFVWGVWSDMIPTDNRCTSIEEWSKATATLDLF